MYHNAGDHFSEVTPWEMLRNGATHGIQWVDFDGNGALDLATCNNNPEGHHYLWRNLLPPERAQRSLQMMVLDQSGHATKPGAEGRIFEAGTRTILGARIIDTGGGYCSQNIMPVHFGIPKDGPVDVEVTSFTGSGRQKTAVAGVSSGQLTNRTLNIKYRELNNMLGRKRTLEGVAYTYSSKPFSWSCRRLLLYWE
jgi:hypothetical protein